MVFTILRWFVKDYENREDPRVREKCGKVAGLVGIFSNAVLFVMKITAGLLFHSVSVTADAVNNLSDAGSSVVTLVGFKLAGMPADKEHPYGHGRYEYLAGLAVSFVILLIGLRLVGSSIEKIRHPGPVEFSWLTVGILLASILIKLWQSRFNLQVGRLIRSKALEATAADSRNDVLSTAAVLVSSLVSRLSGFQLDGYMGVLVAAFIIYSGVGLIRETLDPLLGSRPDPELVKEIQEALAGYEGIQGYHDLMIHNYGPGRCFVTVHAEVPADWDILASHELIDRIEEEFFRKTHMPLTIHMDPVVLDDPRVNACRDKIAIILKQIDPSLTFHDFRMVPGEARSNLLFDVVAGYDLPMTDMELKRAIRERIQAVNPGWYTIVKVDRDFIG